MLCPAAKMNAGDQVHKIGGSREGGPTDVREIKVTRNKLGSRRKQREVFERPNEKWKQGTGGIW